VDVEATNDQEVADPYAAAMAYEIGKRQQGCQVVVATDDFVDDVAANAMLVIGEPTLASW